MPYTTRSLHSDAVREETLGDIQLRYSQASSISHDQVMMVCRMMGVPYDGEGGCDITGAPDEIRVAVEEALTGIKPRSRSRSRRK